MSDLVSGTRERGLVMGWILLVVLLFIWLVVVVWGIWLYLHYCFWGVGGYLSIHLWMEKIDTAAEIYEKTTHLLYSQNFDQKYR